MGGKVAGWLGGWVAGWLGGRLAGRVARRLEPPPPPPSHPLPPTNRNTPNGSLAPCKHKWLEAWNLGLSSLCTLNTHIVNFHWI